MIYDYVDDVNGTIRKMGHFLFFQHVHDKKISGHGPSKQPGCPSVQIPPRDRQSQEAASSFVSSQEPPLPILDISLTDN